MITQLGLIGDHLHVGTAEARTSGGAAGGCQAQTHKWPLLSEIQTQRERENFIY